MGEDALIKIRSRDRFIMIVFILIMSLVDGTYIQLVFIVDSTGAMTRLIPIIGPSQ